MRILSRKIWRAFPELDQFDDAICKKYVNRAHAMRGRVLRVCVILMVVMFGFVVAMIIAEPEQQFLAYITKWFSQDSSVGDGVIRLTWLLPVMNVIWMPWLAGAITRDYLLERCLKKQLSSASCQGCGYNLIGLTVYGDINNRTVRCPECGFVTDLKSGHITEADIDPSLLTKS